MFAFKSRVQHPGSDLKSTHGYKLVYNPVVGRLMYDPDFGLTLSPEAGVLDGAYMRT